MRRYHHIFLILRVRIHHVSWLIYNISRSLTKYYSAKDYMWAIDSRKFCFLWGWFNLQKYSGIYGLYNLYLKGVLFLDLLLGKEVDNWKLHNFANQNVQPSRSDRSRRSCHFEVFLDFPHRKKTGGNHQNSGGNNEHFGDDKKKRSGLSPAHSRQRVRKNAVGDQCWDNQKGRHAPGNYVEICWTGYQRVKNKLTIRKLWIKNQF